MKLAPRPAGFPPALHRCLAALIACVMALSLGGCFGGGDDDKSSRDTAYGGAENFKFEVKEGLVPKGESAGSPTEIENYQPEGELVADSGFRPQLDGFAFENYGNDGGPQNLGPEQMTRLFGEQVCLSGSGADCDLVPVAAKWMEVQNAGMANGHCEGFSMAALAMFNEDLQQEDFGAGLTAVLDIIDNPNLQGAIAEHFVYQGLPSVLEEQVHGAPSDIVEALIDVLENKDELYTLGIYKSDGTGGHAITPYAVEDKGDGQYAILVYDNNFPGAARAVQVDTNSETWNYVSGTNPDDIGQLYEGDAQTGTLELDPLTPGEGEQPCPFCDDSGASADSDKGSVLPESEQYTEITLSGDPNNHPHLVFEDGQGRQTGIVGGKILQEIPEVQVVKTFATRNWEGAPEPRFRIPAGEKGGDYTITLDGSDLTKPTKAEVVLIGNGLYIDVDDIKMKPGQADAIALPGAYGITYVSTSREPVAPTFAIGLVEDDAAYAFAGTALGLKQGSAISLVVLQDQKVMYVDSLGSESAAGGKGRFILNLTKVDAKGKTSQWQSNDVRLDGAAEEKAGFEYGNSPKPGKALPLVILDKNVEPIDVLKLPPYEG